MGCPQEAERGRHRRPPPESESGGESTPAHYAYDTQSAYAPPPASESAGRKGLPSPTRHTICAGISAAKDLSRSTPYDGNDGIPHHPVKTKPGMTNRIGPPSEIRGFTIEGISYTTTRRHCRCKLRPNRFSEARRSHLVGSQGPQLDEPARAVVNPCTHKRYPTSRGGALHRLPKLHSRHFSVRRIMRSLYRRCLAPRSFPAGGPIGAVQNQRVDSPMASA